MIISKWFFLSSFLVETFKLKKRPKILYSRQSYSKYKLFVAFNFVNKEIKLVKISKRKKALKLDLRLYSNVIRVSKLKYPTPYLIYSFISLFFYKMFKLDPNPDLKSSWIRIRNIGMRIHRPGIKYIYLFKASSVFFSYEEKNIWQLIGL